MMRNKDALIEYRNECTLNMKKGNMAGFVSKQPNGLYCRFSTVTDCPTAWNMTREDYINMKMQEAKEDAEDVLDNYLKPFDMVVDMYYPNNMTKEEFDKFLEETGYRKGE